MKKDLQNAMTNRFQNMVAGPSQQETKTSTKATAKSTKTAPKTPTPVEEPVINEPVVQNIPTPVPEPIPQPTPEPVPVAPVVQQVPVTPVISENYYPQQQNVAYVEENTNYETEPEEEVVISNTRHSNKKSIPLMPEEKSSGVLHIRLGELRSYVDFMTQSSKISYQQYISNLIEQDYEKNKDLYLKYKSFMDQLNF